MIGNLVGNHKVKERRSYTGLLFKPTPLTTRRAVTL